MDQTSLEIIKQTVKAISRKQGVSVKNINSFPDIKSYLISKFQNVNIDSVKIILCPESIMDYYGFSSCGGCYIEAVNTIIVRKRIKNLISKKSPYYEHLKKITKSLDVEDVIVHEMIHAISAMSNRANRFYKNNEEEFVYTNCVDFYKNKGMNEEDMVNTIFLPFILNDISDEIFESKFYYENSTKEYNKYLKSNEVEIVSQATKRGMTMINLYRKYNSETIRTGSILTGKRFSTINLDE